jgi:hypothetical protein
MTVQDFGSYRQAFARSYANGLKVLGGGFKGGDCCIAVAGGKMLSVGGATYPTTGTKATCQPEGGYAGKLRFSNGKSLLSKDSRISASTIKGCKWNHNPGVFIRTTGIQFKLFDVARAPAAGWKLMSAADLNTHKSAFIRYYNINGGLDTVKKFPSGNCCIAVKGGKMLVIKGSATGYQFPASVVKGGEQMRCNPQGGYNGKFTLFGSKKLSYKHHFTAASGCKLDHNPAIYALFPTHIKHAESNDCAVSEWSSWSACGVSCPSEDNKGLRVRVREVINKRKYGGKRCPVLKQTMACTETHNTCCSATTCSKGKGNEINVIHAQKERNGRHHICEIGLMKVGKCDCECGILGVTIHSRQGHSPCMVWGSFKDCDKHRGSQDWLHNRVPQQGVLKIEAEYGYLTHMKREPMPFMPRQRINGELEKTSTHMYVRSTAQDRYKQEGFAEWQIYAEAAGSYRIAVHYSNPTGTTARAQLVTTAGNFERRASRSVKQLEFGATLAGQYTFAETRIKLSKGINTFRMRTLQGTAFPNIDFFRVADLGTSFNLAKINDMDRSIARQTHAQLKSV